MFTTGVAHGRGRCKGIETLPGLCSRIVGGSSPTSESVSGDRPE